MSKKHYRAPEVEETPVAPIDEEVVDEVVEEPETVVEETPEVQKTIYGTVVKCSMVNIRKNPEKNAPVVTTIRRNGTVIIDASESTAEFYKICTPSGIEGFCMREFIDVQE